MWRAIAIGVSEGRIAKLARATGLCRDLDVVIDLLNELLPSLPKGEQKVVSRALLQLGKDRGAAFAELSNTWRSATSKNLIAELGSFCAQVCVMCVFVYACSPQPTVFVSLAPLMLVHNPLRLGYSNGHTYVCAHSRCHS
jgi:CHAD domain-containing protein